MQQHYHIVGIAGAGMSALANLLLDQGHRVTGSDLNANPLTRALQARGALVHSGHDPAYVVGVDGTAQSLDAVITTSAAPADHPELAAARAAGVSVWKRDHFWRLWSEQRPVVAIAGTHGKTTTSAMVALLLTRAGYEPGFHIGSEVFDLGTNARWGNPTAPMVIEADEYDHAFLALKPEIAIVTNVEWDHPDIYATPDVYEQAFLQFAQQTRNVLLTCGDADVPMQGLREQLQDQSIMARWLQYGMEAGNAYRPATPEATPVQEHEPGTVLPLVPERMLVPGLHNLRNGLAALAVAHLLGMDMQSAAETLYTFHGTARRFQIKGEASGILVVDDYAHHPTEVRATLAAARMRYPERRIVAYVQPHTYSRTLAMMEQWPLAFADADVVMVGDVYAAREPAPRLDDGEDALPASTALAMRLTRLIGAVHRQVCHVGDIQAAVALLLEQLCSGDLLITLGAGDGYRIGEDILSRLHA
jgi:UDP-N-acetylmuramate--alanine ligase